MEGAVAPDGDCDEAVTAKVGRMSSAQGNVENRLLRVEEDIAAIHRLLNGQASGADRDTGNVPELQRSVTELAARVSGVDNALATEMRSREAALDQERAERIAVTEQLQASIADLCQQVEQGLSVSQAAVHSHMERMEATVEGLLQRVNESIAKGATELSEAAMESLLRRANEALVARQDISAPMANAMFAKDVDPPLVLGESGINGTGNISLQSTPGVITMASSTNSLAASAVAATSNSQSGSGTSLVKVQSPAAPKQASSLAQSTSLTQHHVSMPFLGFRGSSGRNSRGTSSTPRLSGRPAGMPQDGSQQRGVSPAPQPRGQAVITAERPNGSPYVSPRLSPLPGRPPPSTSGPAGTMMGKFSAASRTAASPSPGRSTWCSPTREGSSTPPGGPRAGTAPRAASPPRAYAASAAVTGGLQKSPVQVVSPHVWAPTSPQNMHRAMAWPHQAQVAPQVRSPRSPPTTARGGTGTTLAMAARQSAMGTPGHVLR